MKTILSTKIAAADDKYMFDLFNTTSSAGIVSLAKAGKLEPLDDSWDDKLPALFAGVTIAMVPSIIIYIMFQRLQMEGATNGSGERMIVMDTVKAGYKLIALDLDGTLLTEDKRISDESKKWLRYAFDHGVKVMFSTGRGLQNAKSFWGELGLDSPMVLLNGAEIWEGPGRLRKRIFLPRDTVRRLHKIAVQRGQWYWGYSVESLTNEDAWTPEMFERDWMKIGIGSHDVKMLAQIREELESWGTLEITRSAPINLEISVKGVNKESGVREVCEILGITMSDVIAMGDSDNDVKLLQAAGLGVAMANSEEHVKAIAGAITASNSEDGVALAIRKYVFDME